MTFKAAIFLLGRELRAEELLRFRGCAPDDELVAEIGRTIRGRCCAGRPRPCTYHEGYLDGLDALQQLMEDADE